MRRRPPTCLADYGRDIINVNIDEYVIRQINTGESPIEEPGVEVLLAGYMGTRVTATMEYNRIDEADTTFLALLTLSNGDGSINTPR